MNLIDKDVLIAEIKRRIQEHLDAGGATSGVYLSERMKEDSYLLSFIDTLDISGKIDKEQPIEGLEKEVIDYFQGMWPDTSTPEGCNTTMSFTAPAILRLIKHFTCWQHQKDRRVFAKLKAKEWCNGYDDAISQFVKIPYKPTDWYLTDEEYMCGAQFEEPIPADAELYYKKKQ